MVLEHFQRHLSSEPANHLTGENQLKLIVDSIDIPLRGWTVVRPVHASVLAKEHCFQITTPVETKYFTCSTTYDTQNWIAGLKEVLHPTRDLEYRTDLSLEVWVIEAKGLPSKRRYYAEVVLDRVLYARTSTKTKGEMLFWGEQFLFGDLPSVAALTVHIFKENEGKKRKKEKSLFVGSVEVSLDSIPTNKEYEKWFPMVVPVTSSPRAQAKANLESKAEHPSLRMKLKYHTVTILPLSAYNELHDYVKQCYLQLCNELEPVISIKAKDQLAQTLLKVLQAGNLAKRFLVDIIVAEVTNLENENLTFRGNTVATKAIDTYMKMVGKKYLSETLGPFISKMYSFDGECEVDPSKTSTANAIENQKTLLQLIELAWTTIISSHNDFPSDLQETFHLIRQGCDRAGKTVGMKLISASVFLRFLCPAILSPSLFHLVQEYPEEKVARALTLIAKTIQNLANFTRFGAKEEYMECLNGFVEKEMSNMRHFLSMISSEPQDSTKNQYEGYIDLGRELAVLSTLLAEDVEKLSEEALVRLGPLSYILDTLKEASAEQLDACDHINQQRKMVEKARANRTLSAPFVATGMRKISLPSTDCMRMKGMVYSDSQISCSEDYVSGCSLIAYTRPERPWSRDKRTTGRARAKTLANTPSRVNPIDRRMYRDIQELLANTANSEFVTDYHINRYRASPFVRSSSFHGTSSSSSCGSSNSSLGGAPNRGARPKAGTLPGAAQNDTYFRGIKDPRWRHPSAVEEPEYYHRQLTREESYQRRSQAFIRPQHNASLGLGGALEICLEPQLTVGNSPNTRHANLAPNFQISLSPGTKRGTQPRSDLVISNFASLSASGDSRRSSNSSCGSMSPSSTGDSEAGPVFFDRFPIAPCQTITENGIQQKAPSSTSDSQPRRRRDGTAAPADTTYLTKQQSEDEMKAMLKEMEAKLAAREDTIAELEATNAGNDARFTKLKRERDEQMKAIITRLMHVESELRKEQTETEESLLAKQQVIDAQKRRIRSLELANSRLSNNMARLRERQRGGLECGDMDNETDTITVAHGNGIILHSIDNTSGEQEV